MRINGLIAAAGLILVSGTGFADGHEGGGNHVSMGKTKASIGFEYRTSLDYMDNKLNESDDVDAIATSDVALHEARLHVHGSQGKVKFDLNYSLNTATPNWGWVEWEVMKMLSIRTGYDFLNTGGWDNENWLYDTISLNPYTENLLYYGGTAPAFEFFGKFGKNMHASLQLTNDVVDDGSGTLYNENPQQPAWILEFSGTFGPVTPLVQFGSFDINHSNFFVLGLKGEFAKMVEAYFDYVMDTRGVKAGDEQLDTVHTAITLDLRFKLKGFTPWLKYAMYDAAQPDDDDLGLEDAEGNSALVAGTDPTAFDDNATVITVGAKATSWGDAYQPYFALTTRMADYIDPADTDSTESRSDMTINLGVMGNF